jgi:Zn finger protein HypA/HybF involved in hydrogenase expression
MPIKPRPFTFECEGCGWTKTVAPRSDALAPGEWIYRCPRCGSEELKVRAAGWLAGAVAELLARRRI